MIGETLAAVEARHAYSVARDPIVRRALDRIAADETQADPHPSSPEAMDISDRD